MQTSSDTLTAPAPTARPLAACQDTKAAIGLTTGLDGLITELAERAVLTGFYETHRDEIDNAAQLRRIA